MADYLLFILINFCHTKIVFERDANGDGEVFFSKNEGIFVRMFEGKTTEINDFACVLKEIIKLMDDKPILSEERYLEILQKIKEKKDREKNK